MSAPRDPLSRPSKRRCPWCGEDPLYVRYHDREWGVPLRDDRRLFELLILEGAQAGLSWITILRKRENYRKAFRRFEPRIVSQFTARDVRRLMKDEGIVRNRLKVEATISNARAMLSVVREFGSFHRYLWQFVNGSPIVHRRRSMRAVPVDSPEAHVMSKDLKRRGFRFVGPTICYAFMQASGMVNDHLVTCFRHPKQR